jgi:hypothetical protein
VQISQISCFEFIVSEINVISILIKLRAPKMSEMFSRV